MLLTVQLLGIGGCTVNYFLVEDLNVFEGPVDAYCASRDGAKWDWTKHTTVS